MATHRIVFLATSTNELRFEDSTVDTDNDMTGIFQDGKLRFAVPTKNVVAIERIVAQAVPAPEPEPHPVPLSRDEDAS